MLLVYAACGSVDVGCVLYSSNMSCCVPGLRFVPFCRLRAAALAVVLERQFAGAGRARCSVFGLGVPRGVLPARRDG